MKERRDEWDSMITRGTDPRLLLGMVVDAWNASATGRLKRALLETAVQTIVAGAKSGALVSARQAHRKARAAQR